MQNQGRALNTQDSWSRKIWINDQIQKKMFTEREDSVTAELLSYNSFIPTWQNFLLLCVKEGTWGLKEWKKKEKERESARA